MNVTIRPDLRAIDVAGMEMLELIPQPAPQLMWVKIGDLVIDDRYQRPLSTNNWASIKRIAREFRRSRFSPVLVAPVEGGHYAVIDGQHRAHAAALCGIEAIPAMVALLAPDEQALAFIEINTRQIRVSGHVVYRTALTAGEEWAVACRDALSAAGCELMTRNNVAKNDKRAGQVFAVGLIRNLIQSGHHEAVTNGLARSHASTLHPALPIRPPLDVWARQMDATEATAQGAQLGEHEGGVRGRRRLIRRLLASADRARGDREP